MKMKLLNSLILVLALTLLVSASNDQMQVNLTNPSNASFSSSSSVTFQANASNTYAFAHNVTLDQEFDWFTADGVQILATRNSTMTEIKLDDRVDGGTELQVFVADNYGNILANVTPSLTPPKIASVNVNLIAGETYWISMWREPIQYDYHQVANLVPPAPFPIVGRDFDIVSGQAGAPTGGSPDLNYIYNVESITTVIPFRNASIFNNETGWLGNQTGSDMTITYTTTLPNGAYSWNAQFCDDYECQYADENFNFEIFNASATTTTTIGFGHNSGGIGETTTTLARQNQSNGQPSYTVPAVLLLFAGIIGYAIRDKQKKVKK